ncbi:hypothetical protein BKA62DRAFT_699291 [Auriculariales sp. MPI-PUGE-AT-0066]|nr:hypothetical protein BKA62DRAFT_699291 [Auriculariales sp. MPI-PUGE-AT-0066]
MAAAARHPMLWFEDGNIVLQAEQSEFFRDVLSLPTPTDTTMPAEGTEEAPLILADTSAKMFAAMLNVFYTRWGETPLLFLSAPPDQQAPNGPTDEPVAASKAVLTSVDNLDVQMSTNDLVTAIKIAHRWQFQRLFDKLLSNAKRALGVMGLLSVALACNDLSWAAEAFAAAALAFDRTSKGYQELPTSVQETLGNAQKEISHLRQANCASYEDEIARSSLIFHTSSELCSHLHFTAASIFSHEPRSNWVLKISQRSSYRQTCSRCRSLSLEVLEKYVGPEEAERKLARDLWVRSS